MSKKTADDTEAKGMIKLYQGFYADAVKTYGPKVAVLMQVGKFFEMYDQVNLETNHYATNIREVASMLEISVSETPIPNKDGSPPTVARLFSGFPEQSQKKYERIIVKNGYRGVFITQNKEGKTYTRSIDHVVSAGTYTEDAEEDFQVLDRWLWTFFCEATDTDYYFHSAAISCSTGQIILGNTSISARTEHIQADDIYLALSTYQPAEVVAWFTSDVKLTPNFLRDSFHISYDVPLHIRSYIEMQKGAVKREEDLLVKSFAMDRRLLMAQLDLDKQPERRRILALLLSFIEEHNPTLIKDLKLPTDFQASEHVRLGNHTLEQLGMISTHKDKENECYFHYFNKVQTACGRRAMRRRLLQPIKDISVLRTRISTIDAWRSAPRRLVVQITVLLKKIYDIEKLYRRIQLQSVTFVDMWRLLTSLDAIDTLCGLATECGIPTGTPAITALLQTIRGSWDLAKMDAIKTFLEKNTGETNGFGCASHPWIYGTQIVHDSYEEQWSLLKSQYTDLLDSFREVVNEGFTPLQEEDQPFAFYATKTRCEKVVKAFKTKMPSIHAVDVKSHFYLHSDEIDQLNSRGRKQRSAWYEAYKQTWSDQIKELAEHLVIAFPDILEALTQTDVNLTLALKAEEYGYCSPTYVEADRAGLIAEDLRHGILEQIRKDVPYVPHSIVLGSLASDLPTVAKSESGMLLFGVNSSGKSSLMKAIGLSVLLAQTGCPVPATRFTLAPYSSIFTRILGNDNLWAGMSSFVVEMTEFRNILEYSDERSLVLGDELCAGTETDSAAALVAAGLECLLEKGASFF